MRFLSYVIQWKFASFSMGRPDYLQDTDVVYNRFQVTTVNFSSVQKEIRNLTLYIFGN